MNFDFDIHKWVRYMLPAYMRKAVIRAYLKVLARPIAGYYEHLSICYHMKVAELTLNALTDVMQGNLRQLYPDVGSFKVFVKTLWDNIPLEYIGAINGHHKPVYVHTLAEAQPPLYSWQLAERMLPYDFYVIVPTAYVSAVGDISSLCNRYKPAGKRYQIIFQNITN